MIKRGERGLRPWVDRRDEQQKCIAFAHRTPARRTRDRRQACVAIPPQASGALGGNGSLFGAPWTTRANTLLHGVSQACGTI